LARKVHISNPNTCGSAAAWLRGQAEVVAAWASYRSWTERPGETFPLDCNTALRNEGGLGKNSLNNSQQRVGKEEGAHNYLSNLESSGGAGEVGGRKCVSRA